MYINKVVVPFHDKIHFLQNCSLFYTKRFCLHCVKKNLKEFPAEIKEVSMEKIMQAKLLESKGAITLCDFSSNFQST